MNRQIYIVILLALATCLAMSHLVIKINSKSIIIIRE